MTSGQNETAAALPKTLMLSYMTNAGTPTRVRRVAAVALGIVGILNLGLMVGAALFVYIDIDQVRTMVQVLAHYSLDRLLYLFGMDLLAVVSAPLCLSMGVMQLTLRRAVKRGNRNLSKVAFCTLIPLMLLSVAISTISGTVLFSDGIVRLRAYPSSLWMLAPLLLGILLIILLKDLAAYLLWIGRSPLEEKPKVDFLQGVVKKS